MWSSRGRIFGGTHGKWKLEYKLFCSLVEPKIRMWWEPDSNPNFSQWCVVKICVRAACVCNTSCQIHCCFKVQIRWCNLSSGKIGWKWCNVFVLYHTFGHKSINFVANHNLIKQVMDHLWCFEFFLYTWIEPFTKSKLLCYAVVTECGKLPLALKVTKALFWDHNKLYWLSDKTRLSTRVTDINMYDIPVKTLWRIMNAP